MEEYTVGSLSDLITGSSTSNKKKVVRKRLPQSETLPDLNGVEESPPKKVKKSSKRKVKTEIKSEEGLEDYSQSLEDEDEPTPKRTKFSENAERRVNKKIKEEEPKEPEDPELVARTIFVGNLPIHLDTKKIKKHFAKYGEIDSVRIRGVPVANPKTPKKVAMIKKEFHPERKSFFGYIRFVNRDDAVSALKENGAVFREHHLRVHLCGSTGQQEQNKAIFVGNLSFYAEDDDLWKNFESCGPIDSVRIVRDSRTGIGKGFGYVNFKNSDAVTLALEMEPVKIKDREVRIKLCDNNAAKKEKKKPKTRKRKRIHKGNREQNNEDTDNANETSKNSNYQGTKVIQKKKSKFDKGALKKKKMIKKIAPK